MSRKTVGLVIGALLVIAGGGGGATLWFLNRQQAKSDYVAAIQARTKQVTEYSEQLQTEADSLDALRTRLVNQEATLKARERRISLKRKQALTYNKTIKARVSRRSSRYVLYEMRPRKRSTQGAVHFTPYDLELHGSLTKLKPLLRNLFDHPKLMVIDKIEVSLVEFGKNACVIKLQLKIFDHPTPTIPNDTADGPSAEFTRLTSPMPIDDRWRKLGGDEIERAQGELDLAVDALTATAELESQRAALRRREAALDAWVAALDALTDQRDANRDTLVEGATNLAEEVRDSANGLVVARLEDGRRLVFQ